MTDPIQKTLTVPLRPDQAFRLFTDNLQAWWPVDTHSLSAGDGDLPKKVTVDPRAGGFVTETKPDGETGRWATVTRWEPGHALGLSWYVGRPTEEATDLLVVFTPVQTGTRVDLTHSGFDRLGETAMAMHGNYQHGWDHVLVSCFGQFCAQKARALT